MAVPTTQEYTSNTTFSSSITLTKPANVSSGDMLLIIVGSDNSNGDGNQWNALSGFTKINEAGGGEDADVAAYYRIADETEGASFTVTTSSTDDLWGFCIRVEGVSDTDTVNKVGADVEADATSIGVSGVTTDEDDCLAFYCVGADGGDMYPFSVSGTGWSEGGEVQVSTSGSSSSGCWGTKDMPTAGATGTATVSASDDDGMYGFQFAIKGGGVANLEIDVNDTVSVNEDVVSFSPLIVAEVSDNISVSDVLEYFPDFIHITEDVQVEATTPVVDDAEIDLSDDVSVSEDVETGSSALLVNLSDDVSVTDDEFSLAVTPVRVSVEDVVGVEEDVVLATPFVATNIDENIDVTELLIVSSQQGLLSIIGEDEVVIEEGVDILLLSLNVEVSDPVAIIDDVDVLGLAVKINTSDEVLVDESAPAQLSAVIIAVNEGISVEDLIETGSVSGSATHSEITTSESIDVVVNPLSVVADDDVEVIDDIVVRIPLLEAVVHDEIGVLEDSTTVIPTLSILTSENILINEEEVCSLDNDKVETLIDDFDDNSIDSSKWTTYVNSATATETGGQAEITITPNTQYSEGNFISQKWYTLVGSEAKVEIIQTASPGVDTSFFLQDALNYGDRLLWQHDGGSTVYAMYQNGYVNVDSGSATGVPAGDGLYLRFREFGGTVYWEYSTDDGSSWTEVLSASVGDLGFSVTNLGVYLQVYEWSATGGTSEATSIYENFNIVPAVFPEVEENILITESLELLVPEIYKDVVQEVTILEDIAIETSDLIVSVGDDVSINEATEKLVSVFIDVNDSISAEESSSAEASAAGVVVAEETTITEAVDIFLPTIAIAVSEFVTITEAVTATELDINLPTSVFDELATVEDITILVFEEQLNAEVSDEVSISEFVVAGNETITADLIEVEEHITLFVEVKTTVAEDIALLDIPSAATVNSIVVSDIVGISDNVYLESILFSPQVWKYRPRGSISNQNPGSWGGYGIPSSY